MFTRITRIFMIFGFIALTNGQCSRRDLLQCAQFLGSNQFVSLAQKSLISNEFMYGNGSKTLLLPSRVALDNIPESVRNEMDQNEQFLRDVLRYHLVTRDIKCGRIGDDRLMGTLQGQNVRFNRYSTSLITVNGAEYLGVEAQASNGKVCVIDRMLTQIPTQSIYEYISENGDLSTFLLLAAKSKMMDQYKRPNMTLLVPDNAAFSKLPPGFLQNVFANTTLLKSLLSNHMANKVFFSKGLGQFKKFTAVSGENFPIKISDQDGYIGSTRIVTADIPTLNGVVHIIDTVLLNTPANKNSSVL